MNNINTGGPAFPLHFEIRPTLDKEWCGMTLRDYFAAKAMQSWISATTKQYMHSGEHQVEVLDVAQVTKYAYAQADAMLKAREA